MYEYYVLLFVLVGRDTKHQHNCVCKGVFNLIFYTQEATLPRKRSFIFLDRRAAEKGMGRKSFFIAVVAKIQQHRKTYCHSPEITTTVNCYTINSIALVFLFFSVLEISDKKKSRNWNGYSKRINAHCTHKRTSKASVHTYDCFVIVLSCSRVPCHGFGKIWNCTEFNIVLSTTD